MTTLPFRPDLFNTVFSNGVVASISDLDLAVEEVERVLKPGGIFYCTVRTHRFRSMHVITRLLLWCRLRRTAEWHSCCMSRRTGAIHVKMDSEDWIKVFVESDLAVQSISGLFPTELMWLWGVLSRSPVRVPGVLRWLPARLFQEIAARTRKRGLQGFVSKRTLSIDASSMILIVARKQEGPLLDKP